MQYYDDDEEKRYPWFFFNRSPKRLLSLGVTILVLLVATVLYFWYSKTNNDPTPDSVMGYAFAILGTFFAFLAGIRYTIYRRSRQRGVGQLNASLNWHISFAVIAFVLLLFHSFGHFNPRTGTYALYGMIALVISGFIGRALDHLAPRVMTAQVNKALNSQGEDRIETISRELQSIVVHNSQDVRGFNVTNAANGKRSDRTASSLRKSSMPVATSKVSYPSPAGLQDKQSLQTSWDLAYISLDELPQELDRDSAQYRFVPDRKSDLERPGGLMPGVREQLHELQQVEHALRREQFYRYIIRYWRIFHIFLAVLTLGLTLWHLEYAATLILPLAFRHYNLLHLWFP